MTVEQLQKTQAEAQKFKFGDKKGKGKEKVYLLSDPDGAILTPRIARHSPSKITNVSPSSPANSPTRTTKTRRATCPRRSSRSRTCKRNAPFGMK